MAKSNHRTTRNGTHQQRVLKFRADIAAKKKEGAYLEGRREIESKVHMIKEGSNFEVEEVDERDSQEEEDAAIDKALATLTPDIEEQKDRFNKPSVIDVEAVSTPIME